MSKRSNDRVRARHDALLDVAVLEQLCSDVAQEFERMVDDERGDTQTRPEPSRVMDKLRRRRRF